MSLQLPDLDDRRYEDLVAEAIRLIPTYAPEWTNHNPSDPGVTLVELFAYLSEMLIYRVNRVTSRNVLSFLKLLNGTNWDPFTDSPERELSETEKRVITQKLEDLTDDELRQLVARQLPLTIRRLRKLERAVTRQDFETLALEASPDVARAHCLPRRNLELDLTAEREGHVSVIVLPRPQAEGRIADVVSDVRAYLTPRVLVATRLHVVKAFFVELTIDAAVVLKSDQRAETSQDLENVQARIREKIDQFFSPQFDQAQNTPGRPWGRNVFTSEVFALLDRLPFIDYVTAVELSADFPERELPDGVGIEVQPHELVKVAQVNVEIPRAGGSQETANR
jgi:hypothetical protein